MLQSTGKNARRTPLITASPPPKPNGTKFVMPDSKKVYGKRGVIAELALVKKSEVRHALSSILHTAGKLSVDGQVIALVWKLLNKIKPAEINPDIKTDLIFKL